MEIPGYAIGFDPAALADRSAIIILERHRLRESTEWHVVQGLRFPMGKSYVAQAKSMREVKDTLDNRGGASMAVDATGVGQAVADILQDKGVDFERVTITGGGEETIGKSSVHVPKAALVTLLARTLQERRLIVCRFPEAEVFRKELSSFQMKRRASGREGYEAAGGATDDLVMAAALALWSGERNGRQIESLISMLRRR